MNITILPAHRGNVTVVLDQKGIQWSQDGENLLPDSAYKNRDAIPKNWVEIENSTALQTKGSLKILCEALILAAQGNCIYTHLLKANCMST